MAALPPTAAHSWSWSTWRGSRSLEYCDEHGMTTEQRLRLFLVVCEAVAFAHQRLIVHRDLKSDNVLVTADGSPQLLDFGIAKLLSTRLDRSAGTGHRADAAHAHSRLRQPRTGPRGSGHGRQRRYSLGVVLYELLTGTRPLRFESRTAAEILRVVTEDEPPLPSAVISRTGSAETASRRGTTVARLKRELAGDLDYIVLKALEKEPLRRYASVDQLVRDIQRNLESLPVLARGRTITAYILSRLVRRHRAAVVTGAVVLSSLLAGLAGTAWQARVAGLERDRAQRRFADVRALAHAVVFDIHDAIASLPGATQAREILVGHALRYLDNLSREAGDDPSLQHEMGVAYGKIGDVQGRPEFSNLGRTADARRSYQRSPGAPSGRVSRSA